MTYRFPSATADGRKRPLPVRLRLITAFVLATLLAAAPIASAAQQGKALPFTGKSDTVDLVGLEQSFRDVARRVSPSVVAITASAEPAPADVPTRSAELNGAMLERLMQGSARIVGTGFCVDADGYILTNEHVIRDAKQIFVTTDDGRTFPALVIGSDPRSDMAILKIPAKLAPVNFAPTADAYRGQWTVAIGNPVGLATGGTMCMSVGVVSAVGRELPKLSEREGRLYTNLIQTTAEVNPGNSGGPLFDLHGNVMGIVTAVVLPHKTTNGIGFAMPADAAFKAKIAQLKRGTPVVYGYLGVAVRDHASGGVYVTTVGEQAPATGVLQTGDVLVRVDGQAVGNESTFVRIVGAAPTNRAVTLVVNRGGREQSFSVKLASHPNVKAGIDATTQRLYWRGAELGTAVVEAEQGVRVCSVVPGSLLAAQGAKPGSVIRSVAGKPVNDLVSLLQVLDETPAELCQVILAPSSAQTTIASGAE